MIDARFESKKRALALTFHGTILIALSPRVSCRKIPQSFNECARGTYEESHDAEQRYPEGSKTKLTSASRRTSIWAESRRRVHHQLSRLVGFQAIFFCVQVPRLPSRNQMQRTNAPRCYTNVAASQEVTGRWGGSRKVGAWEGALYLFLDEES